MRIDKVIFIHGNGMMRWSLAWTPWLKEELDKLGLRTVFETFPDSILARKQYWIPFLKEYLQADENTLLIGWSSGAVAAMRYAERNKILSSILIAPCYTDLGLEEEKISGWFDEEWKWKDIRENQKFIGLLYSHDDEFVPQEEFKHIEKNLTPHLVHKFEDKSHFGNEDKIPEIIEIVKKIMKK